eukprot:6496683-Prymnesium_polylepis.1
MSTAEVEREIIGGYPAMTDEELAERLRNHVDTPEMVRLKKQMAALTAPPEPTGEIYLEPAETVELRTRDLTDACAGNDLARVAAMIAAGYDVNARNAAGGTPLLTAAHRCYVECVQMLVDAGADPLVVAGNGAHALLNAAASSNPRNVEMCELLLRLGAEVDREDSKGITPLFAACVNQRHGVIKLLRERGGDPHHRMRGPEGKPDGKSIVEMTKWTVKKPEKRAAVKQALGPASGLDWGEEDSQEGPGECKPQ